MNRPTNETQAILLLTAPLIIGRAQPPVSLLKPSEFIVLKRSIEDENASTGDLLNPTQSELRERIEKLFGPERLRSLLGRSFQLAQAIERWSARSIWVISQSDPLFPTRLKSRLKDEAPVLLYGCGDASILGDGGLGIVGSRDATDEGLTETRRVAAMAAENGVTVISGGARGATRPQCVRPHCQAGE